MSLPGPRGRAVLLQLSRGDFVVFDRDRHHRRGHLADLNHHPGPCIGWSHRPDAIRHGVVAPFVEEQVSRDVVATGNIGNTLDREHG
jgi:hypothetical protein